MYHTFGLLTACRDWQAMFEGRKEGKGQQGQELPIVVHDPMAHEFTLLNLDMVRIKQRGEQHEGLEVYMQGGAFGVMRDGKVTASPCSVRSNGWEIRNILHWPSMPMVNILG